MTIELPVYVRVGDGTETQIGAVTTTGEAGVIDWPALRTELAAFYRALADEIETMEEVDSAAP
ncbi:hypothetical protein [Streptomyces zaomyceticus]|uniref:hypothetical protein n=1 Tax=Streptomyces zaomyceticus TaxID=68286 RepID=UPI0037AFCAAC